MYDNNKCNRVWLLMNYHWLIYKLSQKDHTKAQRLMILNCAICTPRVRHQQFFSSMLWASFVIIYYYHLSFWFCYHIFFFLLLRAAWIVHVHPKPVVSDDNNHSSDRPCEWSRNAVHQDWQDFGGIEHRLEATCKCASSTE